MTALPMFGREGGILGQNKAGVFPLAQQAVSGISCIHLEYRIAVDFPDDIARMKRVLNEAGYDASEQSLVWLWEDRGIALDDGWVRLPESDNELLQVLLHAFQINNAKYSR